MSLQNFLYYLKDTIGKIDYYIDRIADMARTSEQCGCSEEAMMFIDMYSNDVKKLYQDFFSTGGISVPLTVPVDTLETFLNTDKPKPCGCSD